MLVVGPVKATVLEAVCFVGDTDGQAVRGVERPTDLGRLLHRHGGRNLDVEEVAAADAGEVAAAYRAMQDTQKMFDLDRAVAVVLAHHFYYLSEPSLQRQLHPAKHNSPNQCAEEAQACALAGLADVVEVVGTACNWARPR